MTSIGARRVSYRHCAADRPEAIRRFWQRADASLQRSDKQRNQHAIARAERPDIRRRASACRLMCTALCRLISKRWGGSTGGATRVGIGALCCGVHARDSAKADQGPRQLHGVRCRAARPDIIRAQPGARPPNHAWPPVLPHANAPDPSTSVAGTCFCSVGTAVRLSGVCHSSDGRVPRRVPHGRSKLLLEKARWRCAGRCGTRGSAPVGHVRAGRQAAAAPEHRAAALLQYASAGMRRSLQCPVSIHLRCVRIAVGVPLLCALCALCRLPIPARLGASSLRHVGQLRTYPRTPQVALCQSAAVVSRAVARTVGGRSHPCVSRRMSAPLGSSK